MCDMAPCGPHRPTGTTPHPRHLVQLTVTVEQHVAGPNTLLDLNESQRHPGPDLGGPRRHSVLLWGWEVPEATLPSQATCSCLTSVSRTALCWARMLPRPAMAWGSSVMLCSPSGSASLSDSPAPLWRDRRAQWVPWLLEQSCVPPTLPPSTLLTWPAAR
jgi:hypothetical protein